MSEIEDLIGDLSESSKEAGRNILPVLHRGANNIVRDARENAPKSAVIRYYPFTISYDIEGKDDTIEVTVGPDREKNGQAKLGHLFEYGTATIAPRPHLGPALDRELPNLEEYAVEALIEVVKK